MKPVSGQSTGGPPSARSSPGTPLAGLLPQIALFAVPWAVYGLTLGHDFIVNWDDFVYVLDNPAIRGFSIENLRRIFTGFFLGNYAPVHLLSYLVDYQLWGLQPGGYHAVNVLLHAVNGLLVYRLFLRIGLAPVPAWAAACLFLVHPVQVETVVWISQRKNLLAMLFFLLALERYMAWRNDPQRRGISFPTLFFLALALLSKSAAIFFPAAALLYDLCLMPGGRRRADFAALTPFFLLAAGAGVLTLVSQADPSGGGRCDYPGGTPWAAVVTMLPVLAHYLRDCFWPQDLLPYYMTKIRTAPDAAVWLSGALVILLGALGARLWRIERRAFYWYAFFFLALAPVSQIVPINTLKNDRYLYFPLVGFAGFFGVLADGALRRWWVRRAAMAAAAALLLALPAIASIHQASLWKDDLTLWSAMIRTDPENLFAWKMLAKTHTFRRDLTAARDAHRMYLDLRRRHGPLRGGL